MVKAFCGFLAAIHVSVDDNRALCGKTSSTIRESWMWFTAKQHGFDFGMDESQRRH